MPHVQRRNRRVSTALTHCLQDACSRNAQRHIIQTSGKLSTQQYTTQVDKLHTIPHITYSQPQLVPARKQKDGSTLPRTLALATEPGFPPKTGCQCRKHTREPADISSCVSSFSNGQATELRKTLLYNAGGGMQWGRQETPSCENPSQRLLNHPEQEIPSPTALLSFVLQPFGPIRTPTTYNAPQSSGH